MNKYKVIHVLFVLAISILTYRSVSNLTNYVDTYLPKEKKASGFTRTKKAELNMMVKTLTYWAIGLIGMFICLRSFSFDKPHVYALLIGFSKVTVISGWSGSIYKAVPVGLILCLLNLVLFTIFYKRYSKKYNTAELLATA
jgi:hypothetical protein